MRGFDAFALVAGRATKSLMIACLYELGRWRRDSGFVSVMVYVLYASWTGCAALGGLFMIENDWIL